MARILVTGASGFLGRSLVPLLLEGAGDGGGGHDVLGVARRTRQRAGLAAHPRLTWRETDIGDADQVRAMQRWAAAGGPVDAIVHLAAFYDFTGEERPDYWRTNIVGLQHMLGVARELHVGHFVFSSSLAACPFPFPAGVDRLTERTPATGTHIYARTKGKGEEMVAAAAFFFPVTIVRLAALFSDWCEYAPLFRWLETWLGTGMNARVLGGRGRTALPYLHVSDAAQCFARVLAIGRGLGRSATLIASPDTPVSHLELFEAATLAHAGRRATPFFVPRVGCRMGLAALDLIAKITGEPPFERPWMLEYLDHEMRVDASYSREKLGWEPRARLGLVRRLPFLLEHYKVDAAEWHRRNRAAMKRVLFADHLKIHALLQKHEGDIVNTLDQLMIATDTTNRFASYRRLSEAERGWNHRLVLHELMAAVRTAEPGVFAAYCRELAARRLQQGFNASEICGALETLNLACLRVLRRDPDAKALRQPMLDYVTMTLRFGCDQAQETCEELPTRYQAHATAD